MPLINLIYEQRIALKREQRRARTLLFGFVGSAAVALAAVGYLFMDAQALSDDEAKLKGEAQKNAPMLKEIEANTKELAQLAPRIKTLEGARETTDRWIRIMDHLTRHTPRQTYLTAVRCSASDPTKPIQVSFAGMSPRQDLVGEFILRMQGAVDLENVGLKFTQERLSGQGKGLEFEIMGEIVGTAEAKPKDEAKAEEKKS